MRRSNCWWAVPTLPQKNLALSCLTSSLPPPSPLSPSLPLSLSPSLPLSLSPSLPLSLSPSLALSLSCSLSPSLALSLPLLPLSLSPSLAPFTSSPTPMTNTPSQPRDVQIYQIAAGTTVMRCRSWNRLRFEIEYARETGYDGEQLPDSGGPDGLG